MNQPLNKGVQIAHEGMVSLAIGKSRKETQWKNRQMTWSQLLKQLSETERTRESFNEYQNMTVDARAEIKDTGGFVGGVLKEGRRKTGNVAWRTLLTLDADYADHDFWHRVKSVFGSAVSIYSTHSHSNATPRYRLVAPISRQVSADEYKALSRFIAHEIGIDLFDDSTYEPERLMYWPSTSKDAEYIFDYVDAPWLDPDVVFSRYPMWKDASTWPESSRAGMSRQRHADKQGDPREKRGIIGAFCRTYGIKEAFDTFLSDIYEPCMEPNRYTFTGGTASAGIVVYDNDLFSYSHHGTDPAGGQLTNAFDIVRIHLFGVRDDDTKEDTPIHQRPSYQAMNEWALKNDRVKIAIATEKLQQAAQDFGTPYEIYDDKWVASLKYSDKGNIIQSIHNSVLILRHDPKLRGRLATDEFTRKINKRYTVPWQELEEPEIWTDSDDANLRHYLEVTYGITKREIINDGVQIIMKENRYHPIVEYLDSLKWDGVPRIETLLIDYFKADDNIYTREVSKKWLTAGAARIREPGTKFDYMLILVGGQGIGKSTFFAKLSKNSEWFTDSMSKLDNSKDAMEQLAGKWIIELGELAGMKKYEVEHIKVFLSKQEDSYRPSYGRRTEIYPRQCLFGGTSNREDFLQDATGGRRFWPVKVRDGSRMWKEMTSAIVDQIWAEADAHYRLGEDLYLKGEADALAKEHQQQYTEVGGKVGAAGEFLEKVVPINWDQLEVSARMDFYHGLGFQVQGAEEIPKMLRNEITGVELYVECFGGRIDSYSKREAYEMSDILIALDWQKSKKSKRLPIYGKQRVFERPGTGGE